MLNLNLFTSHLLGLFLNTATRYLLLLTRNFALNLILYKTVHIAFFALLAVTIPVYLPWTIGGPRKLPNCLIAFTLTSPTCSTLSVLPKAGLNDHQLNTVLQKDAKNLSFHKWVYCSTTCEFFNVYTTLYYCFHCNIYLSFTFVYELSDRDFYLSFKGTFYPMHMASLWSKTI